MERICKAYARIYGKTLTYNVKNKTSGTFQDLLIVLIKEPMD